MAKRKIKIKIPSLSEAVTGIIQTPKEVKAVLVIAHGAGAGMTHTFMESLAQAFEEKNIATLRFNFPYMEKGSRRPDRPAVAHAAIEAAFARAQQYGKKFGMPVYVSGKSFGGRMTSQLLANGGLKESKGLILFGFPLHAPGKQSTERAAHLKDIRKRMLFHQGTRDTLADNKLIHQVVSELKPAKLHILEGADHSFKTLKSSGINFEETLSKIVHETVKFIR
jgi:predicted alpha/beta-hydrolase family hydrolase